MKGGVEVIDRARGGDEFFGGGLISDTRVGEQRGGGFQTVEIANAGFIGDGQHEDFAAFFAAADGEDADAR